MEISRYSVNGKAIEVLENDVEDCDDGVVNQEPSTYVMNAYVTNARKVNRQPILLIEDTREVNIANVCENVELIDMII